MGQEGDRGRWGGDGEAMTRHTLDLQGKRDEEKPGEGGGWAAYLDWRKRWRRSSSAAAVAAESESGVTYGSGAALVESGRGGGGKKDGHRLRELGTTEVGVGDRCQRVRCGFCFLRGFSDSADFFCFFAFSQRFSQIYPWRYDFKI